jgi:hypothetical protein
MAVQQVCAMPHGLFARPLAALPGLLTDLLAGLFRRERRDFSI